ncbi:MAG: four helix bundle protein [Patescibacteria group bacterium]
MLDKKYKQGYKDLIVWRNASQLRSAVYEMSRRFPKSEIRRVSQMNSAARSVKQNIQEGYRQTLGQYINALKNICQPSLSELQGDIEDCFEDQLITEVEFRKLDALCGKTDYLFSKLVKSLETKKRMNNFNSGASKIKKP